MEAGFDPPRFSALGVTFVVWIATLVLIVVVLIGYAAVQAYKASPSCGDLLGRVAGAPPAEAVRLMQEADDRSCESVGP
jgi:hypothetical protein